MKQWHGLCCKAVMLQLRLPALWLLGCSLKLLNLRCAAKSEAHHGTDACQMHAIAYQTLVLHLAEF